MLVMTGHNFKEQHGCENMVIIFFIAVGVDFLLGAPGANAVEVEEVFAAKTDAKLRLLKTHLVKLCSCRLPGQHPPMLQIVIIQCLKFLTFFYTIYSAIRQQLALITCLSNLWMISFLNLSLQYGILTFSLKDTLFEQDVFKMHSNRSLQRNILIFQRRNKLSYYDDIQYLFFFVDFAFILFSKMPFIFKFQVRESQVEGKGVFALEDIPEGAIFWVFQAQNPLPLIGHVVEPNQALSREQMETMSHDELESAFRGGLFMEDSGLFLYFKDGTQFTNHSEEANTETIYPVSKDYRDMVIRATKPIKAGDEIFQNYRIHKPATCDWLRTLMLEHYPDRIKFEKQLWPGVHEQK